jgi:5-formyltetrahydrofolate cyclo-ligase
MELVMNKEKSELRQKLLAKLLSLTKEELKRRSENVERILSELPLYKEAQVVMVYYPLKGEVNVLEMIRKALGLKRFCFPVMDLAKKELYSFEVQNLTEDFVKGPFGVMQPDIGKTKEVDIKEIDMVIVPGLAFDRQKNRLGRGAGFYDRFLKRITPPTKKVGVAFDFQIIEDLPVHFPFDEKVDIVVSENSVI